jgi:hypothetical protein
MAAKDPIVAVALLTNTDMRAFGGALRRVYTVAEIGGFENLLDAIDDAERANPHGTAPRALPGDRHI